MENKTKWYCQTCNQYFRTKPELIKHKSVHPHKCKFCGEEFKDGKKLGGHQRMCKLNPKYQERLKSAQERNSKRVYHHSQQTKQKLSQIRKQYLLQNPQKHVWKRNTKFKSKPCEDLKQFLLKYNVNFIAEYTNPSIFQNHNYSIDIAFPEHKLAIQVNGNQHYKKDGTLADYYQLRHNIIEQAGWKIIQLHYNETYNIGIRQSLLRQLV